MKSTKNLLELVNEFPKVERLIFFKKVTLGAIQASGVGEGIN